MISTVASPRLFLCYVLVKTNAVNRIAFIFTATFVGPSLVWLKISGTPPEFRLLSTVLQCFDGGQVVWVEVHFKDLSM